MKILFTSFLHTIIGGKHDFFWLPLASGSLISYLKHNSINHEFLEPLFVPDPYEVYKDQLLEADYLCMTNYIWNQKYNDGFAKYYKTLRPDGTVIYGGANVPENKDIAHQYILERPYVDLCFVGPGELNLKSYFDNLNEPLAFHNGSFSATHNNVTVNKDLYSLPEADLPFPYLDGIFDDIVERAGENTIGILFETTRGCPFSCSFCDWGGLSRSKVAKLNDEKVKQTIDWIFKHGSKIVIVDIIDANLGLQERDLLFLQYFKSKIDETGHQIKVTTNGLVKNGSKYLKDIILLLNEISNYSKNVMISFQSHSQQTLDTVNRSNIKKEKLYQLVTDLKYSGIDFRSEMILGLPGETKESWKQGLQADIELGSKRMRAYPLVLIPNTPMYEPSYREKFQIKSKKIFMPHDLFVSPTTYEANTELTTSCDFTDPQLFEEVETIYSCFSYSNEDLIWLLKYWWWHNTFFNLNIIKAEILREFEKGWNIVSQIDSFFDNLPNMPTIAKMLNTYELAIRDLYSPEPLTHIHNVNSINFFQKGMRTFEAKYFIENKSLVSDELAQLYGPIGNDHWHNKKAFSLDAEI